MEYFFKFSTGYQQIFLNDKSEDYMDSNKNFYNQPLFKRLYEKEQLCQEK